MGAKATQTLSYAVRLPDEAQVDALRLLDASRAVVNTTLNRLWPSLDVFATQRSSSAYKQVGGLIDSPDPHGDRQWRCESETAGRILRAQATRKRAFVLIQPILTHGFIVPPPSQSPQSPQSSAPAKAAKAAPTVGRTPAGTPRKNRRAITDALRALKQVQADAQTDRDDAGETTFVALQNVVEQACNYYLAHDQFPATYEEMQPLPILEAGQLTYAGDDGPEKGQAYRLRLDLDAGLAWFRFRAPDAQGVWGWRGEETRMALPPVVRDRLGTGELQAPTLREERRPTGERYAVLDLPIAVPAPEPVTWEAVGHVLGVDWGVHTLLTATAIEAKDASDALHVTDASDNAGDASGGATWQQVGRPFFLNTGGFDGRQARTRRQIDRLKAKRDRYQQDREALAQDHPKHTWYLQRITAYERELAHCWRKYDLRNRTLAHLAANVLLLLGQIHNCSLVAVESLKTLKTTGRGRGVRGRWRHWRNNTTLRGEIWRLLRYKCFLAGVRRHTARPKDTSHTCPRCGKSAQTYRSSQDARREYEAVDWGRWLRCAACGYNGDRDYCASLNIARLGAAALVHRQQHGVAHAFVVSDSSVKPVRYTRDRADPIDPIDPTFGDPTKPAPYTDAGSTLLLPPTGSVPARPTGSRRPSGRGTICYLPGWRKSVFLQSSLPQAAFLRLCG